MYMYLVERSSCTIDCGQRTWRRRWRHFRNRLTSNWVTNDVHVSIVLPNTWKLGENLFAYDSNQQNSNGYRVIGPGEDHGVTFKTV